MKALTLWQPWAGFVARGLKKIETRGWRTNYRGPLAIHAAARRTTAEQFLSLACKDLDPTQIDLCVNAWESVQPLVYGAVVAVCNLTDCVRTDGLSKSDAPLALPESYRRMWLLERLVGDYTPGRWAWLLSDVRALAVPVPYTGKQGLWELPGNVELQKMNADERG